VNISLVIMKSKELYYILSIAVLIIVIIGWFGIGNFDNVKDIFSKFGENEIKIAIEPQFISEGQYEKIPIKIIISGIDEDIIFLTLAKDDITIDRKDKNNQTKVATVLRSWEGDYNRDYVFRKDTYNKIYNGEIVGKVYGVERKSNANDMKKLLVWSVKRGKFKIAVSYVKFFGDSIILKGSYDVPKKYFWQKS